MRATEYLIIVVIIGVFVFLTISGSIQLNEAYPTNPINTTNFTGYEKIAYIQNSTEDIYENFQELGAEDTSWFQKIGAGIVAIPYAVIKMPSMVVVSLTLLMEFITSGLTGLVAGIIILAGTTFLVIQFIREMLSFFQRARA